MRENILNIVHAFYNKKNTQSIVRDFDFTWNNHIKFARIALSQWYSLE